MYTGCLILISLRKIGFQGDHILLWQKSTNKNFNDQELKNVLLIF